MSWPKIGKGRIHPTVGLCHYEPVLMGLVPMGLVFDEDVCAHEVIKPNSHQPSCKAGEEKDIRSHAVMI